MPSFVQTIQPTSFAFFDADTAFQTEADGMVTFVKTKLGDTVLSVELPSKSIFTCFEEATLEYARLIHEFKLRSDLPNILGMPTGSTDLTNRYPRVTMEHLLRMAEPYASVIGTGGSYDSTLGYINLTAGQQDYDIYTSLIHSVSGTSVYDSIPSGSRGKLRILEVFHFDPIASQHMLLNSSNITNFLATEFNYESYVNSTVFYVLPIFEDVLRRSMLEAAHKVRRSNYSYQIQGRTIRLFPTPGGYNFVAGVNRLWLRVASGYQNPLFPAYTDDSTFGVSGPSNAPYGVIPYSTITQPGRQWIRQYCLALCKELLGLIRSKMQTIPIPGSELRLNGPELIQDARADKERLINDFKELLESLTTMKLLENQATQAENINKQLRYVPFKSSVRIG